MERLRQIKLAFDRTRETDPRLVPYMAGASALALAAMVVVGVFVGPLWAWAVVGVLLAALAALSILGRRAQATQLAAIEGQPGAAYAVLQTMRGKWWLQPAVQVTRKQDLVHRVVGRPGVVLVGEGSRARVESLLAQEKKNVARVVGGDVPVHEVSVGDGEGQVPLGRLPSHLTRLPRKVKPGEAADLDTRLSALRSGQPPIPKGYIPRAPKRR